MSTVRAICSRLGGVSVTRLQESEREGEMHHLNPGACYSFSVSDCIKTQQSGHIYSACPYMKAQNLPLGCKTGIFPTFRDCTRLQLLNFPSLSQPL